MISWATFEAASPGLAAFGAQRLRAAPAYLATVRSGGLPRVHPVTPIVGGGHLFLFMEPTSPKGRDLRRRPAYALHSGVPDMAGSGGEFFVSGEAHLTDDPGLRALAVDSATYTPAERYILFELGISEARANGYGDVPLPEPPRWSAVTN